MATFCNALALNVPGGCATLRDVSGDESANLSDFLRRLAGAYGDRIAVAGEADSLTFAALDRAASRWAAAFGARGCGPGTHIGLLAGNGPAWLAVAFGVWRAGATLVPISTFVTARELGQALEHADIDVLVVQPRLRAHDLLELLDRTEKPRCLRQVVAIDSPFPRHFPGLSMNSERPPDRQGLHPWLMRTAPPGLLPQNLPDDESGTEPRKGRHSRARGEAPGDLGDSFDGSPRENRQSPPGEDRGEGTYNALDPESIACILYTSGTTGQPKGVMLSHGAILATVLPTAERTGLGDTDALLSTLPLFWVAGLVIRALPTLATGCTLVLLETFTIDALLTALRRHRPTALHLRPPQVGQLLAHPDFTPELLATVCKGGGRADWYAPHLDGERARLITGYGMTETAGYVTALSWHDPPDVRRTQIGAPLPGIELRIVDADGRPCTADQVGEIRVRGPGMFSGYYKQPPGTGLDDDGFFVTGDLGRIDARGTFHFVGRSKDLLRVKGINVSPMEVEAVLSAHPAVDAAYVVGLPPDGLEQQLAALIVIKPSTSVTEAELRELAAAALSHYKRPERYLFIGSSDVTLSGTSKPQRAALARLAAARLNPEPAT